MAPSHYALLTRPGCHLCDEMAQVLDEAFPALGLTYDVTQVDDDPELRRRFGETVPVLLRDGRAVAKVRLNREDLLRIVRRRR